VTHYDELAGITFDTALEHGERLNNFKGATENVFAFSIGAHIRENERCA